MTRKTSLPIPVSEKGLAAALAGEAAPHVEPEFIAAARAEIAAALKRQPHWKLRARLQAIDAALAGQPPEAAAAIASVKPGTLRRWLAHIRHVGITATLEKWESPHKSHPPALDADAATLRAHAANEKDRHMRKRLLALAYLSEGLSPDDAAARVGLSDATVRDYRRRFQQGGMAAIRSKPSIGGSTKLKREEIQTVAAMVRECPGIALNDLCTRIEAIFSVRYTPAGLRNLLKKQLGIAWKKPAKKSTAGTNVAKARAEPRKPLGQDLNVAELQTTLADTTDWRMKDRLKALIELAEGGEAETVAHSNGVHLETLRKWTRRYRRSGIEGLRGKRRARDGRPPKLTPEQHGTLTKWIVAQPEIDEDGLSAWVKAKFGVSYTPAHMRRLARVARGPARGIGWPS